MVEENGGDGLSNRRRERSTWESSEEILSDDDDTVSVRSWRVVAAPSSPDGNCEGERREPLSTLLPTGLDIAVDPVGEDHHARDLCLVQILKSTPDLKRKGFESISGQHIPHLPVDEEEEIPSTEIWVNLDEKRELEASSAVGASENVHFEHVLKLGRNVNNFNSSNGLIAPETSPAHNPKFIGPETSLDFPSYTSPDAQNNTFANSKVQQQELSNTLQVYRRKKLGRKKEAQLEVMEDLDKEFADTEKPFNSEKQWELINQMGLTYEGNIHQIKGVLADMEYRDKTKAAEKGVNSTDNDNSVI